MNLLFKAKKAQKIFKLKKLKNIPQALKGHPMPLRGNFFVSFKKLKKHEFSFWQV